MHPFYLLLAGLASLPAVIHPAAVPAEPLEKRQAADGYPSLSGYTLIGGPQVKRGTLGACQYDHYIAALPEDSTQVNTNNYTPGITDCAKKCDGQINCKMFMFHAFDYTYANGAGECVMDNSPFNVNLMECGYGQARWRYSIEYNKTPGTPASSSGSAGTTAAPSSSAAATSSTTYVFTTTRGSWSG